MATWVDDLARSLGVDVLEESESTRLLDASRDVAHRVERKLTPLSTFILGAAVERRTAAGAARSDAFDSVLEDLAAALPAAGGEES